MCLYPKLIRNRKYLPNKKNGGEPPPVKDHRTMTVPVGCGRCMECRKMIARNWQTRMLEDIRHNKNGIMTTLTFSNESIAELEKVVNKKKQIRYAAACSIKTKKEVKIKLGEIIYEEDLKGYELDNAIATLAVRRFVERWRKEHKKSVRHWLVTELGHQGTENIHMHGIIWTDENKTEIEKHWQYGYVWNGSFVSEKTVNYIIKYIHKQDADHKEYKSKILTSAGIGSGYTQRSDAKENQYNSGKTKEYYKTRSGHKIGLPIYWRNKIYTDEEKEKLWIEKLDKKERWVNGVKISIKDGDEEYYKTLKWAREINKRMGYQDDKIDWNQKQYEEERRIMLTQKRIESINAPQALRGLGTAPESAESINNGLRPSKAFD